MKHKNRNKKPPFRAMKGGGNENELAGKVFYSNDSIIPANCQIDYMKYADALELHAEVYRLRADEARLLAIIMAGGTIYPI